MVVMIQKRAEKEGLGTDSSNLKKYGILPPFRTIWSGDKVFWQDKTQLKDWLMLNHGKGIYLLRICNGGKAGLKIEKIII